MGCQSFFMFIRRLELFHRHIAAGHKLTGEVTRINGTPERPLVYIYTRVMPVTH
ncbi:hypothetical protein [Endozoicomonas sp.]|uniref:hypothetical protein n=1 Tax=Endozoicomonas sp. TaxID=1892382 RepID=UPI002884BCEA|nr:hypothetical protein [Endozoicomonas sp.]